MTKGIEVKLEEKNPHKPDFEHIWVGRLPDGTRHTGLDDVPDDNMRDNFVSFEVITPAGSHVVIIPPGHKLIFFRKNQMDLEFYTLVKIQGSERHRYYLGFEETPNRLVQWWRKKHGLHPRRKSVMIICEDGSTLMTNEDKKP